MRYARHRRGQYMEEEYLEEFGVMELF